LNRERCIPELEQRIICLLAERDAALKRAQELEKENVELKKKLAFYEGPHTPPSHEKLKTKPKDNEKTEPKKRGAPVGHRGATRFVPEADTTEHVSALICPKCNQDPGKSIGTEEKITEELVEPPKIKVTKFILDMYDCQHCGEKFTARHTDCPTKGNFGVNLLTYTTMLKYYLRGTLRRVEEFMFHQNDFEISTKGLMDIYLRVGGACRNDYDKMIVKVRKARWRHIDETGIKINGETAWLWIFRTDEGDVLVVIRKSRGSNVVREILGENHIGPNIVDGWTAYNFLKIIQRCWSHLLREVDDFREISKNGMRLSDEINSMFSELKAVLDKDPPMKERKRLKAKCDRNIEALVERYDKFKELEKSVGYLRGGLGNWYTCILYPGMEPTNNLGEQAMREHVVMRKIIGCFRSENGSQNYQYIASMLASWNLQGKNMFVELEKLLRRELCLA